MTKHYEKQKNRHPEKQIYSGNKMEQFAPFLQNIDNDINYYFVFYSCTNDS